MREEWPHPTITLCLTPLLLLHPSLESSSPQSQRRQPRGPPFSIRRTISLPGSGPIGVAAIYFGPFSLAPQDPALSRQALLKLSFAYRYYLQPAGIRYQVQRQTATISGSIKSTPLALCAEILAQQIEGIEQVKSEVGTHGGGPARAIARADRRATAARHRPEPAFAGEGERGGGRAAG